MFFVLIASTFKTLSKRVWVLKLQKMRLWVPGHFPEAEFLTQPLVLTAQVLEFASVHSRSLLKNDSSKRACNYVFVPVSKYESLLVMRVPVADVDQVVTRAIYLHLPTQ
jgi:hypothetical protein